MSTKSFIFRLVVGINLVSHDVVVKTRLMLTKPNILSWFIWSIFFEKIYIWIFMHPLYQSRFSSHDNVINKSEFHCSMYLLLIKFFFNLHRSYRGKSQFCVNDASTFNCTFSLHDQWPRDLIRFWLRLPKNCTL